MTQFPSAQVAPEFPLTQLLIRHAAQRGLRATEGAGNPGQDALPTVAEVFALVRDLPYARASAHDPVVVIEEWRGTCSTKHELLAALLAERGLRTTLMACSQQISLPSSAPQELLALTGGQPVVDIHNYLIVHAPQGDMRVDATWPRNAEAAGLPVNHEWRWGEDQVLACQPLETWVVPDGCRLEEFKSRLLAERYTPDELARRDAFIRQVGQLFLTDKARPA